MESKQSQCRGLKLLIFRHVCLPKRIPQSLVAGAVMFMVLHWGVITRSLPELATEEEASYPEHTKQVERLAIVNGSNSNIVNNSARSKGGVARAQTPRVRILHFKIWKISWT
jgi:hypothetical protein